MKQYKNFLRKKTQAYAFMEIYKSANHEITIPIDVESMIKNYLKIKYEIKPNFFKMKVEGSISVKGGGSHIYGLIP